VFVAQPYQAVDLGQSILCAATKLLYTMAGEALLSEHPSK
jgi:hypothetical protein